MKGTFESIKMGIFHPGHVVAKINKLINHSRNREKYNVEGTDIFEEDWDNLLILDACRYDSFCSLSALPGNTESRISRGSTTKEFIRGNFANRRLHDLVYVSANGWFANLEQAIDAEVHDFIMLDQDAVDGTTTRAETVTDAAVSAARRYPDKRLLVHFLQPHQPFIGPLGEKFNHDGFLPQTVRKSDVTREEVIEAYEENLQLVLQQAEILLEELTGKTVVTGDHGELFGERMRPLPAKVYGHPEGVYVPELVHVPWHIYDPGPRKKIVTETPTDRTVDVTEGEVQEHLEDLGYL